MRLIRYEKSEGIATIAFQWPGHMSGPTPAVERELAETVSDFSRDPACRVGILTGSGETFCGEWADPTPFLAEAQSGFSRFAALYPFSGNTDKPVIAAINGAAVGRGFELALDCDIRIASQKAALALGPAQNDRRVIYVAQVLPRLIPFGEAMRLLLSDETLSAEEGKRIGLLQDVVPGDQLLAEAMSMARVMARWGLPGLTATKKVGLFWRNLMLGQSYELARSLMRLRDAEKGA